MADIGDMNAQDPVAMRVRFQADRIIEILGVWRIDRDDQLLRG